MTASGSDRIAIVLFSGGLDSTTCLAIAKSEGFTPVALSFRYGQRHTVELDCAADIVAKAGVEHLIADIDLAAFGGSALVDGSLDVPKHESMEALAADAALPTAFAFGFLPLPPVSRPGSRCAMSPTPNFAPL